MTSQCFVDYDIDKKIGEGNCSFGLSSGDLGLVGFMVME
jgi:hypothetical protein